MAHKHRKHARAVQKTCGAAYTSCLAEVAKRWPTICELKNARPQMRYVECAVAVCFEDLAELRQRWGDIFDG